MSTDKYLNKITGLLLIEAVNSNPNGDPDRESDPRHRPNGIGEISPVSFKAKVRGLVGDKEGPVWGEFSHRNGLAADNFEILESKGRSIGELRRLSTDDLLSRFWDVRIFGTSLLEKEKGETEKDGETYQQHIHTGALQFGTGLSLDPVKIIRNTTTIKRGVQEGKDRGMAPLAYRVVEYGLYAMPFFLNPTVAGRTLCTDEDIQLLLDVIPYAYSHTASYIRPHVNIRHAWVAEHKNPLGSCPDWKILEALTPKRTNPKDANLPAESIEEYTVPSGLPEEIASKLAGIRDIVNE
ncbi:type I CRISPR-associated protein Cas7 [Salidesulfovibrio onnuriiensis]|uniref:type I CRISPR-associated protein Cas7 n=1 Tax=Salidesulfovibrio onnuriiensis TaxID=2583823 RepID=UPI0011CB0B0E|nr:type I CRISPR-associated protein Cas7 [Salidesulfovibrio onnuriiensis]